jgi:peptidoglycan-associated lipoprotein
MKLFTNLFGNNLLSRRFIGAGLSVFLAIGLAACSSSVKLDEAGAPISASNPSGSSSNASQGQSSSQTNPASSRDIQAVTVGPDPLMDPNNPLSKRSVFFDFDSFEIRQDFRTVVEAHAKYLNSNKTKRVLISGNTDERGSREYNLALGQKRAEAVRRALSALGVSESQMEAVSYGEEKPRAAGTDENSWADNRRADLEYSK